jgi:hypothetical protein
MIACIQNAYRNVQNWIKINENLFPYFCLNDVNLTFLVHGLIKLIKIIFLLHEMS